MSELSVGQLKGLAVNSNNVVVPAGHTLYPPGHIIQVQQKFANIPYAISVTAHTFYTYPNNELAVAITPKFSTSKILVQAAITVGSSANQAGYRFTRNGAAIGVGSTQGTRMKLSANTGWLYGADANHSYRTLTTSFLDSPGTTSTVNYNIDLMGEGTTLYLNRSASYSDSGSNIIYATVMSTLTVMEVAQ